MSDMPPEDDVTARLEAVRHALRRAERTAGRTEGEIALIAVSKTFSGDEIEPALVAGQRLFGENRVQEAKAKWPDLRERYDGVELHLIGPLQSNKAAEAVALFDVIHTVDRQKIAEALAKEMALQNKRPRLFVQVNVGEEPQKAGVAPSEVDAFVAKARDEIGLTIEGLMCIPPADEPPAPYFALLDKLARRNGLKGLSMGMSADFAEAAAFGATHVRVGSAIFGSRPRTV
ncbi:MAG: YggS family pyridoxal phosphate-dependent enzyme [Hansschlegelia sp.]